MAKPKKTSRDWLEPPEWWKKVRPLRWLAGALVLISLVSLVRSLLPAKAVNPTPEGVPLEQIAGAEGVTTEPSSPPAPGQVVAPSETALAEVPPTPATPNPVKPAAVPPAPASAPPVAAKVPTPVPIPVAPPPVAPPPVSPPPTQVTSIPPPHPAQTESEEALGEVTQSPDLARAAYTRIEPNRVVLMGQFRSYSNVDDISGLLKKAGHADVPIESRHVRIKNGDIPPNDIDHITLEDYKHLGQPGTLHLSFYNDRLFEAEFRPTAAEDYLRALRKAEPRLTRTRSGRTEFSDGPLYVNSSLDLAVSDVGRTLGTKAFVLWQDVRLVKQRDQWDGLYAVKAAR
ncbi:MAG TPA: hypothetical protein VM074_00445 [Solimonas sp.]|nr:hypothetical protein [Solimonas sp.]